MELAAVWQEDQSLQKPILPKVSLKEKHHFDVAIIGAGYTGLHAALHLAQAGVDVGVFDSEHVGYGASHRNAGMMLPGYKAGLKDLLSMFGEQALKDLITWSYDAIDYVKEFAHTHDIDLELNNNGQLLLATKPAQVDKLKAHAAFVQRYLGHDGVEVLDRTRIHEEIDSPHFFGGLVDPDASGINPYKYMVGLKGLAEREELSIFEHHKIERISRIGSRFLLEGAFGQASCEKLFVATNGYSELKPISHTVFPVGSYMIATEPLAQDVSKSLFPKNRMMFDCRNFLNYFRLTKKNQLLFGGRNNLSPSMDALTSAAILKDALYHFFPALRGIKITHSWGGKLGLNARLIPAVGIHQGIYFATGCCGHGVATGSLLGKEMASWIKGAEKPLLSDFRPVISRGYKMHRYFLPVVGSYFRLKDQLL